MPHGAEASSRGSIVRNSLCTYDSDEDVGKSGPEMLSSSKLLCGADYAGHIGSVSILQDRRERNRHIG
jgi:hypothetical protein